MALLHIVMYQPEIPFNAGNAGRTCVALGAKLWLVKPLGFLIDSAHVRRAGLDYWDHLDYQLVDNWDELCEHLPGERIWFLTKTGRQAHTTAEFAPGDVLVFGNESSGLPPSILDEHADRCLRIPMRSEVRSLNLAVSVGIVAYEAYRQLAARGAADIQQFD